LNASHWPKRRFNFELFWLSLEGFDDDVKEGWSCEETITNPFLRLDACYPNLAAHLQAWGDKNVGNLKLKIAIANLAILCFDAA
jgi:hypothetical protein